MATLNIGGQRVKVDDAFLSMTPEQQQQTVEEIAGQLGAQPAPANAQPTMPRQLQGRVTPQAARPTVGSANIEDRRPAQQQPPLDLGTATAATISGIVNGIPVLGPMAQDLSDRAMGGVAALGGGDYGQTVAGLQRGRAERAERAPISDMAGNIAGGMASIGGLGQVVGNAALGLGGKVLPGIGKAAASNQALYTADQHARGNTGMDTLGMGLPALAGAGGRVAGEAIDAAGRGLSDTMTRGAQRGMTKAATAGGAPSSSEFKSAASKLLEEATDNSPLMVSDTAYLRFLGDVRQAANKLRINSNLDQKSVGLLETFMQVADDVSKGGVAVDMKDLHILRQAAQKVAMSAEGRDAAFANQIIRKMDDFIQTLKPADILGGANPAEAANSLMRGISTWHRASKVSAIEEAIRVGSVAASGAENGIRNSLRAIVKNKELWRQFNKAEQQAILDVVEGTGGANLMKLIGKFGFGSGNASNMLGGTIGFGAGSLSPLGPIGGILAAGGATAARKGSEAMTTNAARRALAAAGTQNIPIAPQAPNLLSPAARPADLLIRASGF